jgi:hypothetical protein
VALPRRKRHPHLEETKGQDRESEKRVDDPTARGDRSRRAHAATVGGDHAVGVIPGMTEVSTPVARTDILRPMSRPCEPRELPA